MLRARLHSKAFPLAVLKNRSYIQAYSLATKSLKWDSGLRHLSTRIRNQSAPEAYSANYTMSKAAIVKYNGGNRCIECRGVFTENPLSKRSRKSCICIGCKRLYAQCRNNLDRKLMKSVQTSRFGHGICSHNMMCRQIMVKNYEYFTANKYELDVQADFTSLTQMAERWGQGAPTADDYLNNDIWNDQRLDLSTVLDVRASNFLQHTKRRYRKLFPDANPTNEKFIFPTKSQLRGLMEASNGVCRWSGLQGLWRTNRSFFSKSLFLLTIDHIVPVSKCGSPNVDNLQVVLSVYNLVKGSESEDEFQRWLFRYPYLQL